MKKRFAFAFALLLACEDRTLPPRGQLVVFVDTNAPLALAPGEILVPDAPAPLFDRLRIDLLDAEGATACDECSRDFAVSRDMLAARQLAFGLLPRPNRTDLVVRVRLFKGSRARGGVPASDATIDRAFVAPAINEEGVVEVTAFLPLDAVGAGPNLETPEPLATSKPQNPAVLDPRVVPAPCSTTPRADEVCVPGGAFWMSDPQIVPRPDGVEQPSRVAAVAPFFVDAHEVTVAEMRATGLATTGDPKRSSGDPSKCTYTNVAGAMDELPVTCASWVLASKVCAARGGRLPTEAELELLLGRRTSSRYPWGQDDPACEDVVAERVDPATLAGETFVLANCARHGIGPAKAGTGRRDVVVINGERIFDLAGNAAEWTVDTYEEIGKQCWRSGFVVDPICDGKSNAHTVRGGGWGLPRANTRSTNRAGILETAQQPGLGFRCVRPGR